ncbi:hypothetical protein F2P81_020122 [Scophthalmus maximus]|uniref:Uncharacterized protein n=1 Tax=Scophthalmus maximus TaxID=52904 RepID=A0A6A4S8G1_SCOMX|nr:hypothetical protein F2P81_020122 [Scophthalmus maximus]
MLISTAPGDSGSTDEQLKVTRLEVFLLQSGADDFAALSSPLGPSKEFQEQLRFKGVIPIVGHSRPIPCPSLPAVLLLPAVKVYMGFICQKRERAGRAQRFPKRQNGTSISTDTLRSEQQLPCEVSGVQM